MPLRYILCRKGTVQAQTKGTVDNQFNVLGIGARPDKKGHINRARL